VPADEEAREEWWPRTENAVVTFLDAIVSGRVWITDLRSGEGPMGGSGASARDMASP
jgi:hypothetical protein